MHSVLDYQDVIWAYRLCLDREPESDQVIREWAAHAQSRAGLIGALVLSAEYTSRNAPLRSPSWHYQSSFDAIGLISKYAKSALVPSPAHVTNFLGVKIRPEFLPGILAGRAGTVEKPPIPDNWHADIAEWGSCLRALDLSGDRFVLLELGCGWGCWMNNLGVAAKSAGKRIRVLGIEADQEHLRYAERALADNGISPAEYGLTLGIAGKSGDFALFPKIASGIDWGGAAVFDPTAAQLEEARASGRFIPIPVIDIEKLIEDEPRIDFLHVDIQGAELELLAELAGLLRRKMRYVFIGTHSKQIEAGLFDLFSSDPVWKLEMERAATFRLVDGRPQIAGDGIQAWRNSALD
jgi:FkbM family methyltransferase